jgi:DNA-binding transcriptional LysR family regulator
MDLRTLRYLLVVADEGSISAAALRLHMSQPPLSTRLQTLERELGVTLLNRHGRGVELTDAGRLLVERTRRLLVDVDGTADAVRAVGQGAHGRLGLAVSSTVAPSLVAALVAQLRDDAPDVRLHVSDLHGDAVRDRVRHGDLDAGLVHLPPSPEDTIGPVTPTDRTLEVAVVEREPLVAVLPSGHPQAESERVDLATLTAAPLIAPTRSSIAGLYEHVLAAWLSVDGDRDAVRECDSTTTMLALVEAGLGAAIIPSALAAVAWPSLVVLPLRQHRRAVETAIVWRRDATSPVLRRFLRLALATPEPDVLGPALARHSG